MLSSYISIFLFSNFPYGAYTMHGGCLRMTRKIILRDGRYA